MWNMFEILIYLPGNFCIIKTSSPPITVGKKSSENWIIKSKLSTVLCLDTSTFQ